MCSNDDFLLRDRVIGLQAEVSETRFQESKIQTVISTLREDVISLENRLANSENVLTEVRRNGEVLFRQIAQVEVEIAAIRKSRTWRIGSSVLAPVRWVKRSKS